MPWIGTASEPDDLEMMTFCASHDESQPDVRFCSIEAVSEERVRAEKRELTSQRLSYFKPFRVPKTLTTDNQRVCELQPETLRHRPLTP
jgi:hypothetical protein